MLRLSIVAAVLLVSAGPLRILTHAARRHHAHITEPDCLIVLGTAQYDGRPSRQFAARLDHAINLWNNDEVTQLYTVGGNLPGDRFTEAAAGRDYLINHGVRAENITAIEEGNDTRGSYEALLREHPELQTTLIVTDPNHSLRAERLARQTGLIAYASPTQTSPTQFPRISWWLTLSHEVGGLIVSDVSTVLGRGVADKVETLLRRLQSWLRPSRRARHEQLAGEN